jgi:hypothetical protein
VLVLGTQPVATKAAAKPTVIRTTKTLITGCATMNDLTGYKYHVTPSSNE